MASLLPYNVKHHPQNKRKEDQKKKEKNVMQKKKVEYSPGKRAQVILLFLFFSS